MTDSHGLAGQHGHRMPWTENLLAAVAIMGIYETWIVPRMLDLAMRSRLLDHYRQWTIETALALVLCLRV